MTETISDPRICIRCRIGAHDHCECQCEVCANAYTRGAEFETIVKIVAYVREFDPHVADDIVRKFASRETADGEKSFSDSERIARLEECVSEALGNTLVFTESHDDDPIHRWRVRNVAESEKLVGKFVAVTSAGVFIGANDVRASLLSAVSELSNAHDVFVGKLEPIADASKSKFKLIK
jgi:hypothetical protein